MITDFTGATWRKSSRSADTGSCVELAWHESNRSASTSDCAEALFGVRDSKNAAGPVLALAVGQGLAFLGAIRSDRLTRS